jgi:creatinine amidohydrolase
MWLNGEDASWTDVRQAAGEGAPAVLPFGAFEQHGPHLPLSTDTAMAAELARRVAKVIGAFLLPAVAFGETSSNDGFPGTVSLSFDTVRAIALDVCEGVRRCGFRCLIVVNGDFGNQAPLRLAAREALTRLKWPMLVIDYPGLVEVAAEVCESSPAGSGLYHADELETSVMLALRPAVVHMDRSVAEYPSLPATFGSVPSRLHDLSRTGVFGDPGPASAEKGELILEALTERAVALARSFLASASGAVQAG